MNPFIWTLLLACSAATAQEKPRITRAVLHDIEKSFDSRVQTLPAGEPLYLLGDTRGVYLDGFGAVFTAELNLVITPGLTLFRPPFTKEEIAKVRARKLRQLPLLKARMREMLAAAADSLPGMPSNERIVLGVTLFYYSWEDRSGLPSQIVMQGERAKLLDRTAGEGAIRIEEL